MSFEMSLGAQLSPQHPAHDSSSGSDELSLQQQRLLEAEDAAAANALMHRDAQKAFFEGRLKDALNSLQKLKDSAAHPDDVDPAVSVDHLLVRSAMGDLGTSEMLEELEEVYERARENDFDVADHAPLVYNLALASFLMRKFVKAYDLLKSLYSAIAPHMSCATSSSPSHQQQHRHLRDVLRRHVLPLLCALANELHQPTAAITYLGVLEKTALASGPAAAAESSPSKSGTSPFTLYRAHAFLNARQHKQFKKDLKSTGLDAKECVAFEFMRANLEYLKGNHKKAVKLLLMAVQQSKSSPTEQQPISVDVLNASSPHVMSHYHNNLGCIHMATGKPYAARYNFQDAVRLHSESASTVQKSPDAALRVRHCELLYNLGLNLLHIGQHIEAFDTLMKTIPFLSKSPHAWLHLAECCIAHHSEKRAGFRELIAVPPAASSKRHRNQQQYQHDSESNGVTFMLEGASAHQKIVMVRQPTGGKLRRQQLREEEKEHKRVAEKDYYGNAELTLDFAHNCLINASYCLDLWASGKPNPLPLTSKTALLRSAILLKQSYVSLCLDNPVGAYQYATRLLNSPQQNGVPAGHRVLARLYSGEALILLDRISEAVEQLDPLTVQDVSLEDSGNSDDAPGGAGGGNSSGGGSGSGGASSGSNNRHAAAAAAAASVSELIATRALFSYNLAVAFLIRGELDRAGDILETLSGQASQHKISDLVLMANLYVLIKKGKLAEARKLVRRQATLRSF